MGPAAIGGQKLSLPEKFPDTMEEPKAPSEALRATVPRGWGLGRDAVAPQIGGPEKFSYLTCKSMHFYVLFALNSTLNLMTSFP